MVEINQVKPIVLPVMHFPSPFVPSAGAFHPFGRDPAIQPADTPSGPCVVFRPGPEERPFGSPGRYPPWGLLAAWADRHRVDEDLALLLCACAAAHAAGPWLYFEGDPAWRRTPAPTVISTAGDTRFDRAAKAAVEPLLEIQRKLVAEYEGTTPAPVPKDRYQRFHDLMEAALAKDRDRCLPHLKNPARGMDPDRQPDGPVRFVLEGALPAQVIRFLKGCHLYAAVSVAEIERLPRSGRSREARSKVIARLLDGYLHDKVSIRGFMRFTPEDLEWLMVNSPGLIWKTLPVGSADVPGPVLPAAGTEEAHGFGCLHRDLLRRIVALRFERAECGVDFHSGEAVRRFGELRDRYRAENGAVAHLAAPSVVLPDLLVWYLLQLGQSLWVEIDETEVAVRAIEASRRLRRRVAVFHRTGGHASSWRWPPGWWPGCGGWPGRAGGAIWRAASTGSGWSGSARSSTRWSGSGFSPIATAGSASTRPRKAARSGWRISSNRWPRCRIRRSAGLMRRSSSEALCRPRPNRTPDRKPTK